MKFGTVNVVPPSEIASGFVNIHSGEEMSKPMYSADGRIIEGEDSMSGVMYNAGGIGVGSNSTMRVSPRFGAGFGANRFGNASLVSPRFGAGFVPPSAKVAPLVSPRVAPINTLSAGFEGETEIELSNFDKMDIGVNNIMSEFVGGYKRADFSTANVVSGFGGAKAERFSANVSSPSIFSNAEGEEKKEETTTTTTTTTTAQSKPAATAKTESGRILGMQRKTAMFVGGALLIGLGVLGYYKFVKK